MQTSTFVRAAVVLGGIITFQLALAEDEAPATTSKPSPPAAAELSDEELQKLIAQIAGAGFYSLRDPEEAKAIEQLRQHADQAAPELAKMLAQGHQDRRRGWINVYRPMYVMIGMGSAAKVALPDVIKALDDDHPVNVTRAAILIADIGPAAKESVPALLHAYERTKGKSRSGAEEIARTLYALDPEGATKAGIPVAPAK